MDEAYHNGVEVNTDTAEGTPEAVQWQFRGFRAVCDLANYEFQNVEFDYGGQDIQLEVANVDTTTPALSPST